MVQDSTLGIESAWIAVEVMFREVNQNSLSLLCLSCEAELFEEFTECNIKGVTFEAEVFEVFFCHHTTEVVAENKKNTGDYLHKVSRLNHATVQNLKSVKIKTCKIIFVVSKLTQSTVQENISLNYVYLYM
jgi:hypothetical protein